MAGPNTLTFTDAGWDSEVLQSDKPVLVDFWATWCGPCSAIAPSVDALADEYAGKLKVGKLDVESNTITPGRYRVGGIPTLLLIKGGQVVDQLVGNADKSTIRELIDKHVTINV